MTRNNKMWHSSCKHCATTLTNVGSGRPKTVCRPCRLEQMKRVSKGRYKMRGPKIKVSREYLKSRDKQIIVEEKLRRGACLSCNLQVTHETASEFDFDHFDRSDKFNNVSKLKGRQIDTARLLAEMLKCELLCCRCHRRKTLDNKEFTKPKTRVLQTTLF